LYCVPWRVFENRVLRGTFKTEKQETAGECRKIHNKVLHNLYCSPKIIRVIIVINIRWARRVPRVGDRENAYNFLFGKPEGKRPLGRSRRRLEEYIRMDLKAIGWEGMDWIHLVQDMEQWRTLVYTVMNIRMP